MSSSRSPQERVTDEFLQKCIDKCISFEEEDRILVPYFQEKEISRKDFRLLATRLPFAAWKLITKECTKSIYDRETLFEMTRDYFEIVGPQCVIECSGKSKMSAICRILGFQPHESVLMREEIASSYHLFKRLFF